MKFQKIYKNLKQIYFLLNNTLQNLNILDINNENFEWDRQKFVDNQRPSLQPFLNSIIGRDGVQYFERVIFCLKIDYF